MSTEVREQSDQGRRERRCASAIDNANALVDCGAGQLALRRIRSSRSLLATRRAFEATRQALAFDPDHGWPC
jgi:hypothetical protein